MRVIAGTARGIPLKTVPGQATRPILDRLKKSLFSILDSAGLLAETRVLDLYCGAGTQGIEALSRGCDHCDFVDSGREATSLLEENLQKTRLIDRATVHRVQVGLALRRMHTAKDTAESFDLILYDPPFEKSRESEHRAELEDEMTLAGGLLSIHGRLVLRCEKKVEAPKPKSLELVREWSDGKHGLFFYGRSN